MAVAYLYHHFGREFLKRKLPFAVTLEPPQMEVVLRMMEQNLNSPKTSSCGRLFDAVAALVGIRSHVNYEAQAAIELEMAIANDGDETSYAIDLKVQNGDHVIDTRRMFEQMLTDLDRGLPVATISRRFHNALIAVFTSLAESIRTESSLTRVCLSGGTFHNVIPADGSAKTTLGVRIRGLHSKARCLPETGDSVSARPMIAAHQLKVKQSRGPDFLANIPLCPFVSSLRDHRHIPIVFHALV